MKLVINTRYGGFGLSAASCKLLDCRPYDYNDIDMRTDEKLISVVEKLGNEASGSMAALEVVEIPDDYTDSMILDYDGIETVYYVVDGKIYSI